MKTLTITTLIIILTIIISLYYSRDMKRLYKKEVKIGLERTQIINPEILTEVDIQHLPTIVQNYLRYVGVIGKEKVHSFRAEFEGNIRSNPSDGWMKLSSVQYNFTDKPTRIFYITAKKMGIPAFGIHLYKDETAIMLIKMLGLFTVADAKGPEMNQGETVTVFNDMCFMAPATLIDKNIKWEIIDTLTVKAHFTNGGITVSATLFFNEKGELINFISNDRFETKDGKIYNNYPWKTPVNGYREINGYRLATGAQAIYEHPEGDFCYGEFIIKNVEYNCKELK
ncbi:MAG: DUF6544 family protein [Tenuifilaceae bacterium]